MAERIGTWVKREKRHYWHLVESLVANDAVTACGRRLTDEANSRGELVYSDAPAIGWECKGCQRG